MSNPQPENGEPEGITKAMSIEEIARDAIQTAARPEINHVNLFFLSSAPAAAVRQILDFKYPPELSGKIDCRLYH